MATVWQATQVIRTTGIWRFAVRVWQQVSEDNLFVWASSLAYSWLFAFFFFFTLTNGGIFWTMLHRPPGQSSCKPSRARW